MNYTPADEVVGTHLEKALALLRALGVEFTAGDVIEVARLIRSEIDGQIAVPPI